MKKENEIVVLQPEFETVLSSNKEIELTKAQAHASAFAPSMVKYHDIAKQLSELDKENPTPEMAKIARRARLDLVPIRTEAGTIKDERKAILLTESNLIQNLYNVVKNTCELTEGEFLEIEKHQERLEAEAKAKLKLDREAILLPFEVDTQFIAIADMSNEQFEQLLANSKLAFETRKEQEKQAELARIEAEKKAEDERLENLRIAKIEQDKKDAELAELQKKQALRDKRASEMKNYVVWFADYNFVIELPEAEYQKELLKAIDNEKKQNEFEIAEQKKRLAEKAEQDKKDAELKKEQERLKSENDKLKQQQEQEKSRIEAEEAEKLAKEKALANAGDREKVKHFYETFKSISFPDLNSEDGKKLAKEINEGLALLRKGIVEGSKTLL